MAYKDFDGFQQGQGESSQTSSPSITIQATGDTADLPDASFVRDADIMREGADLVLNGPDGEVIIEGYFSAIDAPTLIAPDGAALTPELVDSFVTSAPQYAMNTTMSDVSPIGAVSEMSGDATVTRTDGSTDPLRSGMDIFQGDIIETGAKGAINITFSDESSFAVSEDTRLAIDEYVYDASSQSGAQNFSVLKGVFVFTSGLIGRDDPDDVEIDTPMGSIGIRGTIIAGDASDGEITVVEGAIVLRDPLGGEMTLANQFETAKFSPRGGIENMGQIDAKAMMQKFAGVTNVAPKLFSSINDAAAEQAAENNNVEAPEDSQETQTEQAPESEESQKFEADGATDQNGDNEVDGTVEEAAEEAAESTESADETQEIETQAEDTNTTSTEQQTQEQTTTQFAMDSSGMESNSGMEATTTIATASTAASEKKATAENANNTKQQAIKEAAIEAEETSVDDTSTSISPELLIETIASNNSAESINIEINTVAVDELAYGVTSAVTLIATITAENIETLTLTGDNAAYLTLVQTSNSGIYNIYLNAGSTINFEELSDNGLEILITGTNAAGASQTVAFTPDIIDINETPTALSSTDAGIPDSYFSASSGNHWDFTFQDVFTDPDAGDTLTFILDSSTQNILNGYETSGLIDDYTFNSTTGHLHIEFLDDHITAWDILSDTSFDINITAFDTSGLTTSQSFTFNLDGEYVRDISTGDTITSTDETYSTNDTVDIDVTNSSGISVYTGDGSDEVNLSNTSYTFVSTGNAADVVDIENSDNNEIVTGYGDDEITIDNSDGNSIYAMQGNDEIILTSDQIVGLQDSSYINTTIDGGSDDGDNGDILSLELTSGQNVDFSAILSNGNDITNIETIRTDNGHKNEITLTLSDLIQMTDSENPLILDLDNNDTLNFDSEDTGDAIVDGTETIDGETYDVYTFDDVTLLVNQDAGAVNIA